MRHHRAGDQQTRRPARARWSSASASELAVPHQGAPPISSTIRSRLNPNRRSRSASLSRSTTSGRTRRASGIRSDMPMRFMRCSIWSRDRSGPAPRPCPVIGSQGRRYRGAVLFPHPPFNPYVRFSRIRLTDDLLDMVTLPSDSGLCPSVGAGLVLETRWVSSERPVRRVGCGPAS